MGESPFATELAEHIWQTKYRHAGESADRDIGDTWQRVADALASAEGGDADTWRQRFLAILQDFRFLPGGRVLAGAGTEQRVTLFNCFVMGRIEDSVEHIFDSLKEGAVTLQAGGGVGYDFSTLRPAGSVARASGRIASGPVSFMHIWDAMCGTILSTGARRGAMMATLRCDHPDIERFIDAKRDPGALRRFNLSVQVSDAFMQAVAADDDWPLVFPEAALAPERGQPSGGSVVRRWSGDDGPVACRVLRSVSARALWSKIMRATYDWAEPGVLFVDQINRWNNLAYCEQISASNPCGELPLPPYGACDLGSINLTRFVQAPFSPDARLDLDAVAETVRVAVRLLDNVIDVSRFPLERQAAEARGKRRIGLGVTGLADALIMLGAHYAQPSARKLAAHMMATVCHSAYRASVELAREKGSFPMFERDAYLAGLFVRSLPEDIRTGIAAHGIRNSHLLAIAPTGTISLLADNVSSGIEPVFDFFCSRRVLTADGGHRMFDVEDRAHALWRLRAGSAARLPGQFVNAFDIAPHDHLAMQAALQPYVDSAISKTINVPADYPFAEFQALYELAHRSGLKGCTTFRPNPVTGEILGRRRPQAALQPGGHCCTLDREAD